MKRIGWTVGMALAALMTVGACAASGGSSKAANPDNVLARATFAGGCFWCMEPPFEKLDGVGAVVSGYTGGRIENPTYEQVSAGGTRHVEAVEVRYDSTKVSYATLLEVFWRQVDPTDADGQFVDRGSQYGTAIFYHDEEQRRLAEASKAALGNSGRFEAPVITPILPAGPFYAAEEYHQDYYKKNPVRYKFYRFGSGRDRFLGKNWKDGDEVMTKPMAETTENAAGKGWKSFRKPTREQLEKTLTPLQFKVTQKDGTERAYQNEYWNEHRDGIYVDVVSGEPLYSSRDKFESGTGWPSFSRPLEPGNIVEKKDRKFFMERTEVRSRYGDSHLGHVFGDGPPPTGKRHCINSAALRFVPAERLVEEGYGEYAEAFGVMSAPAEKGDGAGK